MPQGDLVGCARRELPKKKKSRRELGKRMAFALAVLISVSVIAYRDATSIFKCLVNQDSARLAVMVSGIQGAIAFLKFYVIVGIPLAFLNGYLLRDSWIDCLISGIGTWVGTLAVAFLGGRTVFVSRFFIASIATLVWLAVDGARFMSTINR
jgi:hypothetical protein